MYEPGEPELLFGIDLLLRDRGGCGYDGWQGQFGRLGKLRGSRRRRGGVALFDATAQGRAQPVAQALQVLSGAPAQGRPHRPKGTPGAAHEAHCRLLGRRRLLCRWTPRRHVHHRCNSPRLLGMKRYFGWRRARVHNSEGDPESSCWLALILYVMVHRN